MLEFGLQAENRAVDGMKGKVEVNEVFWVSFRIKVIDGVGAALVYVEIIVY